MRPLTLHRLLGDADLLDGTPRKPRRSALPEIAASLALPPPTVGQLCWAAQAGRLTLRVSGRDAPACLTLRGATLLDAALTHTDFALLTPAFVLRVSPSGRIDLDFRQGGTLLFRSGDGTWQALKRALLHARRRYDVYQPRVPRFGETPGLPLTPPTPLLLLLLVGFLEADTLEDAFTRGQHHLPLEDENPGSVGAWPDRSGCGRLGHAASVSVGDHLVAPDGTRWEVALPGWKQVFGPDERQRPPDPPRTP